MLRLIAAAIAIAAFNSNARAAEIKVLSTVAMAHVLEKIAPKFEAASGHRIVLVLGPSGGVAKRVADGEPCDLLLSTRENIDPLIKDGKLAGPRVDVATSSVGVAVKAGAPKPDISTPDALKATLLAAKSLAFSNPATGGASGVHFAKVLDRLGIAKEVMAKAKLLTGEPAANYVASGEVELAVHQIPELKVVKGAEIAGPLPPPLQATIEIGAAIPSASTRAEPARALVAFLASPDAVAIIKDIGMSLGKP